ncbi:BamA/TamA family outer membrane protein [Pontibacter sp. BT310]|uniref:BamA/TamA family outer membrane protein n=1 Tax=Pontibacter populi TaxID=890055 RepID=A0ABS6XG52_9BACT|nr:MULTISPECIES: BamA/TamA family outer membrane protein [Pontibacter]MBJ6120034.1 BamA/TamA family outer membrane protein [Pontibacter sp. BT310]MBR0572463.1 BamA/TamA family outer membrane protein [Microvirga sp. STS03]MBW3366887.1 BamA/TamA family outer membrane protein [Pontibacter populi]
MKSRFYIFGLVITILFSAGCVPTKDLGEDEQLLVSIKPQGLQQIEVAEIENLYQQQPNRMFLGSTPYLVVYNIGKKFYDPPKIDERIRETQEKWRTKFREAGTDSAKVQRIRNRFSNRIARLREKKEEGNFLMQLGEPPAIYDSTLMVKTIDQISIYLNAHGYFKHTIDFEKEEKEKLAYVTLNISENEPYRYNKLNYSIPDTAILALVKASSNKSLLQLNDIFNEDIITEERTRIYELLRNNGYYDFARAYIEFEIDTLATENGTGVTTIVLNPETGGRHQVYSINNVYFKTDSDRFGIPRDTITYNNINYVAYDQKYSTRILDKKVDIYPGQKYSQLNTATTQRKLADLDVFQFNNVQYNKITDPADSSRTNLLNAYINALPSKRFQETTELGVNYTERTPGPFSSIRLRVRNVFGGAENLDLGIRGGLEGQISLTDPQKTVMIKEFGGDMSLTFPFIIAPGGRNMLSRYSPRTRIYTGFTNVDRQEYKRSSYELSLDYIWQKSRAPLQAPTLQYIFSPLNLTIVEADPNTFSDDFKKALQRYRSFEESFTSGIISSMSFNLTYNTNDFAQTRNARFFRGLVEVGGLSQELGVDLRIKDLETFQFARLNPDYRRYIPLGNKRYFVYRINTGIASPILNATVLPYEKHFFAGGASSVRAWQSRRLGPGTFADTTKIENTKEFIQSEQPGNILIEASTEYRFNIFSFLNGALFVDAGNIWTLEKDPTRPGSSFQFNNFYKELAVGTGFGLRFDLSVLVLRFDFSTKVYDPSGINGKKFVLGDFRFSDFFTRTTEARINQSNLNIGIGYPF